MALTTADQVRLRIQDQAKPFDMTSYGDGTAVKFALPYRNITSGTAYVPLGSTAWSATGGVTFNASGFVTFTNVISANSAYRVEGVQSVFSDDEIGHFTAIGGNVNGAALEAIRTLQFDGLRRARWMAADGSQYDDTNAIRLLLDLEQRLLSAEELGVVSQGALSSWSLKQEDYE